MRCEKCGKYIDAPIAFCPSCGAPVPEEAREQLRKEKRDEEAADEAVLRKWKKLRILTFVEFFVVMFVILPIALYVGLKFNMLWIFYVVAVLWVGLFIFFGFVKGGVRCPFCGGLLGNSRGGYCQHCSKKIR